MLYPLGPAFFARSQYGQELFCVSRTVNYRSFARGMKNNVSLLPPQTKQKVLELRSPLAGFILQLHRFFEHVKNCFFLHRSEYHTQITACVRRLFFKMQAVSQSSSVVQSVSAVRLSMNY